MVKSRSTNSAAIYYRAVKTGAYELELMALIDRQCLQTPFYGSRRMAAWLQTQGHTVNRKRVQRLMQRMGLAAIYQRPRTSRPAPEHRIYPYLLRGLRIERGTAGVPEELMVLTVPDIAIIDGPGYRRSYGETTKRASEGSVLSRQRSHEARWGREHSRSESVGLYVAD